VNTPCDSVVNKNPQKKKKMYIKSSSLWRREQWDEAKKSKKKSGTEEPIPDVIEENRNEKAEIIFV